MRELLAHDLPGAAIVETNTYYEGSRGTTEQHRRALRVNGWDFAPVDILDEWGTALLPVTGGTWFREMSVGVDLLNYDSLLALTHFKGHALGGFGGANKNIGIGCADGRIGKAWIHTPVGTDDQWGIGEEEFMERMTESSKAVLDRFGRHVAFVNVMRNMSVSCDTAAVSPARRHPGRRHPRLDRHARRRPGLHRPRPRHDRGRPPRPRGAPG